MAAERSRRSWPSLCRPFRAEMKTASARTPRHFWSACATAAPWSFRMAGLQALIAELTHRCPLHCVYCSNPVAMRPQSEELTTEEWARVFGEAGRLGALQVHLT